MARRTVFVSAAVLLVIIVAAFVFGISDLEFMCFAMFTKLAVDVETQWASRPLNFRSAKLATAVYILIGQFAASRWQGQDKPLHIFTTRVPTAYLILFLVLVIFSKIHRRVYTALKKFTTRLIRQLRPAPKFEIALMDFPLVARRQIVSSMSIEDIISYSFVSKDCKDLVRTLRMSCKEVVVVLHRLTNEVSLRFPFSHANGYALILSFGRQYRQKPTGDVESPIPNEAVWKKPGSEGINLELPAGYSLRNLIDHFVYILKSTKISVFFAECDIHMDYITKSFEGLNFNYIRIDPSISQELTQSILREYYSVNRLAIWSNPYGSPTEMDERLFSRQWDHLTILKSCTISFEQLVHCKALNMEVHSKNEMKGGHLNTYLRGWIDGRFPALQTMFIDVFGDVTLAEVLDGIDYTEAPEDLERPFYRDFYLNRGRHNTIRGGYDIKGCDGIGATLTFNKTQKFIEFLLVVWH